MYDSLFCRLYDDFGWNEYPRVFAGQLLEWLSRRGALPKRALDLGCGTGVLCQALALRGIKASGIDLSPEMIDIARSRAPGLDLRVANMVTWRPEGRFDLIICTGDALNHLSSLGDVARVFENAREALNPGGLMVFDLLREDEIPLGEPFEADYDAHIRVRFHSEVDAARRVRLRIDAFEDGAPKFSEVIEEALYDVNAVLALLRRAGFDVLQCADRLLPDGDTHGATWFIIAQRCAIQGA